MHTADKYKKIFAQKLVDTVDFDKAFNKAVWIAYNDGLLDGLSDVRIDKTCVIAEVEKILDLPKQSNGTQLTLNL